MLLMHFKLLLINTLEFRPIIIIDKIDVPIQILFKCLFSHQTKIDLLLYHGADSPIHNMIHRRRNANNHFSLLAVCRTFCVHIYMYISIHPCKRMLTRDSMRYFASRSGFYFSCYI